MNSLSQVQNNPQPFRKTLTTFSEQKRPLVLIAEGVEANRRQLKALLNQYSVSVLEVQSGETAIDLVVVERPDLILINTELPVLDGFEATRLIRAIKAFDETPIIFLSGQTDRTFRKKAFAVGADGFHIAPLNSERLNQILENFLFRIAEKIKIEIK